MATLSSQLIVSLALFSVYSKLDIHSTQFIFLIHFSPSLMFVLLVDLPCFISFLVICRFRWFLLFLPYILLNFAQHNFGRWFLLNFAVFWIKTRKKTGKCVSIGNNWLLHLLSYKCCRCLLFCVYAQNAVFSVWNE